MSQVGVKRVRVADKIVAIPQASPELPSAFDRVLAVERDDGLIGLLGQLFVTQNRVISLDWAAVPLLRVGESWQRHGAQSGSCRAEISVPCPAIDILDNTIADPPRSQRRITWAH